MDAVAVNNTFVPLQIEPADAFTEIVGADVGFTVIVTPNEVAVVGEAQPELEVITTVITSLLFNEEDE